VLQSLFLQVKDAVVYAHTRCWARLHVQPANIISDSCHPDADYFDVMVIDWGFVLIAQMQN
jgi:hypothetical protein